MYPVLIVQNLQKRYGHESVIKDVSFELYPGEIVGLIGRNGCGKTTILSMIAGIKKKTCGEVFICGKTLTQDKEKYYQNLSVVFDSMPFYPYLSGSKNLFLQCRDVPMIIHMLKQCGLYEARRKPVSAYSLGMKQKLNIARALLRQTKLILMDEPFNGLDPKALVEFKANIKEEISENQSTLLVSSHALKELLFFCNRYLFVKDGVIFADIVSRNDSIESIDSFTIAPAGKIDEISHSLDEKGIDYIRVDNLSRLYFSSQKRSVDSIDFPIEMIPLGQTILENIYLAMSESDVPE